MRNRQRGAYSFLFLVVLIAGGLLVFALAADGARLYAQQRILQQQADAIALAAAQDAQACGGWNASSGQVLQTANEAAIRAGYSGTLSSDNVLLGVMESVDQRLRFVPVSDIQRSNAVYVALTEERPRSLLVPGRISGATTLRATAAAKKELVASVSAMGSTAVVGGTQDNANLLGTVLGGLLGSPGSFSLTPTDLQSLSSTLVSVGDLLSATGVATVAELLLLDGEDLALALRGLSTGLTPATQILDALLVNAGIDTVRITDVIEVVGDAQIPPESSFPLYDLLVGLVLNVAEGQVFQFPATGLNIGIPGVDLLGTNLTIAINDAPAIVTGPARQDASGAWLTRVESPDINLGLEAIVSLGSFAGLTLGNIRIPIVVQTGAGDASLIAARCAGGMSNAVEFRLDASSSVARLRTAVIDELTGVIVQEPINTAVGTIFVPLVGTVTVLNISADVNADVQGDRQLLDYQAELVGGRPEEKGLDTGYGDPQYVGAGAQGLATQVQVQVSVLQGIGSTLLSTILGILMISVNALLNGVTSLLDNVISALLGDLISPLLSALGADLGEAAFELVDAQQSRPQLIHGIEILEDQ